MQTKEIALHMKEHNMKVQLRYNTHFDGKDGYRWRLLVNGKAILLIDFAVFNCPSFTSEDEVEVDGKIVKKCHISCVANELLVTVDPNTEFLHAVIN